MATGSHTKAGGLFTHTHTHTHTRTHTLTHTREHTQPPSACLLWAMLVGVRSARGSCLCSLVSKETGSRPCVSPVRRDWPHLAHSAFVPLTVAAVKSAPSKTARSSSLPVSDESRCVSLGSCVSLI